MTKPAVPLSPRPRVLVCVAGVPHPTQGASAVLFFHYIRQLRDTGYEILHVLLLEGKSWSDADVAAYAAAMGGSSAAEICVARSPEFVKPGRMNHQMDRAALVPALDRARRFKPNLILAFDLLPAWATIEIPARRRIVWLGDLNFQTVWSHAVYAVRENPRAVIHLPSNWLTARTWRKIYQSVLRNANQVIVASDSSRDVLAGLGVHAEYEPYPWPETVLPSFNRHLPDRPTFLFFGSLGGLGSRSALHFTLYKLYPRWRRLWGENGFFILIAGRGALPAWFAQAIQDKPEFKHLGFVEDIDGILERCHAVLAPIDVPIGNRSRILTAMAKGALVIAHANAALGNPDLVDGETCYLSSDADGFVERMKRAVSDEPKSRAIVERARRRYETRFHPDVAGPRLIRRIAALVDESRT